MEQIKKLNENTEIRDLFNTDGSRIRVCTGEAAETNRWIPDQVTETEKACAEWKESAILLRMRVQEGTVSYFYGRDETLATS